jgi:hypothetical protein
MTYISRDIPDHIPLFKPIFLNKKQKEFFEGKKKEDVIQFKSSVIVESKPCGCMANKIKEPESS